MKTILDTGPLVALINLQDNYHNWTLQILERLSPPLWTCEAVITEASYLTGKGQAILSMLSEGNLQIGLSLAEQSEAVAKLLAHYKDRMDLADACLVRMSELFRNCQVFTLDKRDFSFYRRNGREVIPLLAP
ncbi:pilus assembly protein [Candidatus Curtissbacteria bacterium]|nr:pilus assembly protein [Candidatus Curtissbacteria bacterium]